MANLLASLVTSTGALRAYDKVLQTTQNNVANASTPGFARQKVELSALAFDPDRGTPGGVWAGELQSARDSYSEAVVRRQTTALGAYRQQVRSLTGLEGVFSISHDSGIPGALSGLYEAFSDWSVSPNDAAARETVLSRAQDVATSFNQAAAGAQEEMRNAENEVRVSVERINEIAAQIVAANTTARSGAGRDPALDAKLTTLLEDLSQYADVTAVPQDDGTYNLVLGGQVPLVVGTRQYELSSAIEQPELPERVYGEAPGVAVVRAFDGTDVTGKLGAGQLGAVIDYRNRVLAGVLGDPWQEGDLNRLARTFADRVNEILTSGISSAGPPEVAGVPLFTYPAADGTSAAAGLAVSEEASGDGLGAIDPGPPSTSNGIPLRLSALAAPDDEADMIDSLTYVEFYGLVAGGIGQQLADAEADLDIQDSLLAQAKDLRQQYSGVNLDEEAITLVQFQRSYQAMAQLVRVLDSLTEELIGLIR